MAARRPEFKSQRDSTLKILRTWRVHPDQASAQEPPVGTWTGVLEVAALEMIFHFAEASSGGFEGTMDVPAQGATGVPLGSVGFESGTLSFLIPGAPGGATGAPGEYALIEVTLDPSVLDLVTEWILERFGG